MGQFPENDIPIFKSYAIFPDRGKSAREEINAIIGGIRLTNHNLPDEVEGFSFPENATARKLQEDRHALVSALKRLAAAKETTEDSFADQANHAINRTYHNILSRHFALALGQLNDLPFLDAAAATTINQDTVENALRKDTVRGRHVQAAEGGNVLSMAVMLVGYGGPEVEPELHTKISDMANLLRDTAERRFRVGVLTAECWAGLQEFDKALDEYGRLLEKAAGLSEEQRKFLTLKAGWAHSGSGDNIFRALAFGDDAQRVSARGEYQAARDLVASAEIDTENPIREDLESYSSDQIALLDHGFNILGYSPMVVSDRTARALLEDARAQTAQAERSVGDFVAHLEKAIEIEGQVISLDDQLAQATHTFDLATAERTTVQLRLSKIGEQKNFVSDAKDAFVFSSFGKALSALGQIWKAKSSGGSADMLIAVGGAASAQAHSEDSGWRGSVAASWSR